MVILIVQRHWGSRGECLWASCVLSAAVEVWDLAILFPPSNVRAADGQVPETHPALLIRNPGWNNETLCGCVGGATLWNQNLFKCR